MTFETALDNICATYSGAGTVLLLDELRTAIDICAAIDIIHSRLIELEDSAEIDSDTARFFYDRLNPIIDKDWELE